MLTLGIETSGRAASVALRADGQTLVERTLGESGRRHAQTLVAEIDAVLKQHGKNVGDCQLVAVSVGPGSFTGLRIGVVCAKTLAYATGCALAAVDTLACIAENSPPEIDDVHVIADAQRGDLYVGRYRRDAAGRFVQDEPIAIAAGQTWCAARAREDVVSGPGIVRFEADLAGAGRVLPAELRNPTAARVADLGERRFRSGRVDDFWGLEPFYLRKSSAEEKWDARDHGATRGQPL